MKNLETMYPVKFYSITNVLDFILTQILHLCLSSGFGTDFYQFLNSQKESPGEKRLRDSGVSVLDPFLLTGTLLYTESRRF